MAAKSDDIPSAIVVPSNDAPSMFNNEALDGALIGNIVGGRNHELLGTLAGGAIGGMLGKERMEREHREGRTVHKPYSAAASIIVGTLVGGLIGALGAFAFAAATPVLLIAAAAGVLLGGIMGYATNQAATRKYEAAKSYFVEHGGHYQGREREAQKEHTNSVTPEEYARLQERLARVENQSHAQSLDAEHMVPSHPTR